MDNPGRQIEDEEETRRRSHSPGQDEDTERCFYKASGSMEDRLNKHFTRGSCKDQSVYTINAFKVTFIMAQVLYFALIRGDLEVFLDKNNVVLKNMLLKNWDTRFETDSPNAGRYAVYTIEGMKNHIEHAVHQVYRLPTSSVGTYFMKNESDPVQLCLRYCRHGFYNRTTNTITVDNNENNESCTYIGKDLHAGFDIQHAFENVTGNADGTLVRILSARLGFTMASLYFKTSGAQCFTIDGKIFFNNEEINGQMLVTLTTHTKEFDCEGSTASTGSQFEIAIHVIVLLLSFLSIAFNVHSFITSCCLAYDVYTSRNSPEFSQKGLWQIITVKDAVTVIVDILVIIGTIKKVYVDAQIMGEELKKALSVLKNELCSLQSEEFNLPVEYHCEDNANMVSTFSQDTTVGVDKELKKALSVLKNELCSQQSQEFKLPVEYHCEDDANMVSDFSQDTIVGFDNDKSTTEVSMLRRGVLALLEETRYRCSIITDFDLPFDFVQSELDATESNFQCVNDKMDVNATIQKKRRSRKSNTRAKRQQDRDRKRKQRRNVSIALGDITDTHVENLGTPWKKMYGQNIEYKQKKKAYSKLRYKLNVAYRQAKKNLIKRRYKTDSKFRQTQKDHSKSKYNADLKFREVRIALSKTKYNRNLSFQQKVRNRSRTKYANDAEFQQKVKDASKSKYANDPEFQQKVKDASKSKYANDPEFQQKVKDASKGKYGSDPEFQQKVKDASKNKYASDPEFQERVKDVIKNKYTNDPKFQETVKYRSKERNKNKYANDSDFKDTKRKLSVLRYRENILLREKYKRKLKQQYNHELLLRQRKIAMVQRRRLAHKDCKKNLHGVSQWFKEQVRDGPTFVCSVCYKFKFRKQVMECDKDKYSKKGPKSQAMADQCISNQFCLPCDCGNYCENISHKLWVCYTCNCHLLKGSMPADANVNGLQMRPIPDALKSLNKLEKQLIALRIPFMKMVQLPKGSQRGVIGPCVSIPTDIEKTTSILPRFEDDAQLIRCKLKRKLAYKGHSQYEFVSTKRIRQSLEILKEQNNLYRDTSLNPTWEESMADIIEGETNTPEQEAENVDDTSDTEQEDQTIIDRGLPSDTCLQPVDIGQEILDQHFDNIFCVAPGEGKTPVSMMQEVGNEAMSFPVQFPEGSVGSFDSERQVRITRSRYFQARLLSADSRFSTDSSYLFYAQYLSELEQVISKVSIAMRKSSGKDATGNVITANMLTDRDQLKNLLTTDQGYKFLTPIRGTPPYWQAALRDLMAMIRQLGIPTWFATFSAADLRWSEILEVLLKNQNSQQSVEDLDWAGKAELLKNNPVMNAVLFNHRFQTFLKEIIIKREIIGKVRDHFHRIEFQQRGSPHAHCLFWIQDAPQFEQEDDQTVCDFIDRYVSCELPDETADPELHHIVSSVQQHSKSHSKSCKKKGTTCRFNFPRAPSEHTFISRPQSLTDPSIKSSPQEMIANAKVVLNKLMTIVQEGSVQYVTTKSMFDAAGITHKQFEEASNILTKRTNVVHQRKPSDVWINQYNPDLIRCWNANMDLQYITDPYSCVMYIISYISKAEREMGVVLENARKEAAQGNCNAQDAMKKIGSAYFRQREVSAQEAAYRVCGLHLKESSRKVQFVPCGDNPVRMSLPLNVIKTKDGHSDEENIWMVSFYDRYKARPDNEIFENLCYAAFCSEYCILSPSQLPKNLAKSNIFKLQNDLGFIRKRTRTNFAVVRYPRFSEKKNPEQYYQSILQLFLPHRNESQLKPQAYQSYEEMYLSGAVTIKPATESQSVKIIVITNKQSFETNAKELDEAEQMLETQGPLEDAWAMIAPEAEAQRIECNCERNALDEEDAHDLVIPELDSSTRNTTQGNDIEIRQTNYNSQQMQAMLRGLNAHQKEILYKVRQWCLDKVNGLNPAPFRIFVNGGAGTGKSHLIKCLHYESTKILSPTANSPDDILVLLTAPTATAAFNIGGATLHQTFSLSKALPLPYIYKRDDELNKLRTKLQHLNILIVDEISMVGQRLLIYISERLRQIKQSGDALFGNTCVIAVGDFYQLPPVKQKSLFDLRPENYFPLWTSNFSVATLDEIMRQKDDSVFAQLLNRLRVKKKSEHLAEIDRAILESCTHHSVPLETLHIFGTNKEVSSHNSDMIESVCEKTQTIFALDYDKDVQTGALTQRESPYDTSHDFLPAHLMIGTNARVMLIRNVDVGIGLVNGAMGTVSEVLPPKQGSNFPQGIMVLFDNEKVGVPLNASRNVDQSIKITAYEENLKNNAIRRQFPLQLAWACTVHKVQGISTDKAVVSLRNVFAAGMAYVALSRVTKMEGLVIKDLDESKIYCNEQICEALANMPQYLTPTNNENIRHQDYMVIVLHNIQGLIPHIDDLRSNSDISSANLICLTETWLEKKSTVPSLEGYKFMQKQRCSAYTSKKDFFLQLRNKKHGGVGIYARNSDQCFELIIDSLNMECVVTYIKNINANVVLVYRPEVYTMSVFIEELYQVLITLPQENVDTSTIVLGDFNQDILKTDSPIKTFMEHQGFRQIVSQPTTDGNSLIDHVYISGNLHVAVEHAQTYYSYHNIVTLKIKFDTKLRK